MSAPKLTALGRVIEVGGGKVYVDVPPNCTGEEGAGLPASADAERAYAPMLLCDAAVRITVEPADAPVSETLRPVEQVAADMFGASKHYQSRGWITPLFGFELQMAPSTAECIRGSIATALLQARMDGAKAQLDWSNECDDEPSVDIPMRPAEDIAREMLAHDEILCTASDWYRGRLETKTASAISIAREEGAAAALSGQQPPDLAGRIRALSMRWFNAWASLGTLDHATDAALRQCLDLLRGAERHARGCPDQRSATERVTDLRFWADAANEVTRPVFAKVADELEAIVRDAGEP